MHYLCMVYCRAGHMTLAVLWLASKDCFKTKMTIKIAYLKNYKNSISLHQILKNLKGPALDTIGLPFPPPSPPRAPISPL